MRCSRTFPRQQINQVYLEYVIVTLPDIHEAPYCLIPVGTRLPHPTPQVPASYLSPPQHQSPPTSVWSMVVSNWVTRKSAILWHCLPSIVCIISQSNPNIPTCHERSAQIAALRPQRSRSTIAAAGFNWTSLYYVRTPVDLHFVFPSGADRASCVPPRRRMPDLSGASPSGGNWRSYIRSSKMNSCGSASRNWH